MQGNQAWRLSPRCGAVARHGAPCRRIPKRGHERCRLHGGASTGPKTLEGRQRIAAARTVHGRETRENRRERARLRAIRRYIFRMVDFVVLQQRIEALEANGYRVPAKLEAQIEAAIFRAWIASSQCT